MARRKILLVAAVVVATLGATLVFLYAQGAESRAVAQFQTVKVLSAAQQIERGESVTDALAAGKVVLEDVTVEEVLEGAGSDDEVFAGQVALTTVYPGEQLLPVKFGAADEVESTSTLPVPEGKVAIAVSLTDQGRVGDFTRPGSEVAIYLSATPEDGSPAYTRMLLPRVTVIGAGSATQVQAAAAERRGGRRCRAAAQHAADHGRRPDGGREGPLRPERRHPLLRPAARQGRARGHRGGRCDQPLRVTALPTITTRPCPPRPPSTPGP